MTSLVYTSSATKLFSDSEIVALADRSRSNNAGLGITGMLLYKEGCFVQLLEGDDVAVEALFRTIDADNRHRGVTILLRKEIEQRHFPEWSMGYTNLKDPALRNVRGFSVFADAPLHPSTFLAAPNQAAKLLNIFRRNLGV